MTHGIPESSDLLELLLPLRKWRIEIWPRAVWLADAFSTQSLFLLSSQFGFWSDKRTSLENKTEMMVKVPCIMDQLTRLVGPLDLCNLDVPDVPWAGHECEEAQRLHFPRLPLAPLDEG